MAENATTKAVPHTTLQIIMERIKQLSRGNHTYSVMFAGECDGAVKVLVSPKDFDARLQSWEIWTAVMEMLDFILDGLNFKRDMRQSTTLCNCTLHMA